MINSRKIEDLTPAAQKKCKEFIEKCSEKNIRVKVISTLRDSEYQKSLYELGRTVPGKKITNCDGTKNKSVHQSGNAFDAVPLDDAGKILWESPLYKTMADVAVSIWLTAGYYFRSLKDSPHFQLL